MTNARETCTKPDLLPCPFCGSANIDPEEWRSGDGHGPGCSDCGACADTLERWNSRPVNREDGVAALGALLVHLPENWGDCIRDGEMRLTVDENAIQSALEAVAEGNPNLRRSVVMSYELALHLLRNPYGHSDDLVRQARLWAADRIEAASRHQSGQQRIRIETTVGGHLAVTLLPSGASALFRSTGEIGETIAHSLPNRFEAPIGECHQVWQWHPAAELPALSKHACSETVIATDGKRVAVRYYDFHDNEWRGERGLDGYLWEVTHWAPMPPMPDSQSVAGDES